MSSSGGDPSNLLRVPNAKSMSNGEARTLKRLANSGKNDSVKSTYSLSVFLDPDASKDMVRHEELWYPMEDPSSAADNQGLDGVNQGPRTSTLSQETALGSRKSEIDRLMLTQAREQQLAFESSQTENYRQNEELMRNGGRSTASSTVVTRSVHRESRSGNESGTDVESHFNKNTVVLGMQSGAGGRAGGGAAGGGGREEEDDEGEIGGRREARTGTETRQELGHNNVRRWSTEGDLQRAFETPGTEDEEGGDEDEEQEEVTQVRSQTGAPLQSAPPRRGLSATSDSAADEEAVGYSTRVEERSDFRHGRNTSGTAGYENVDGFPRDTHTKQGDGDSSTEEEQEDDGYEIAIPGMNSFGANSRGAASSGSNSAADEDRTVKYSSTMQPRTTIGLSRNRSGPTSFTDDGRPSNAVNYDDSTTRMTSQGRKSLDEDDLTLTEGSDEGETGNSYHREPIRQRPRLRRAMQVDGEHQGIDSHPYQNGTSSGFTFIPRNISSVQSEGELVDDSQRRRGAFGFGREGIQRTTAQSEDETRRASIPSSQMYSTRRTGQEVSSTDDRNNRNTLDGTLNRRNDPSTQTYYSQGRMRDGSFEGEVDGLRQNGRQVTPVNRVITPNSPSSHTGRGMRDGSFEGEVDGLRQNGRQVTPVNRVITPSSSRNHTGRERASQHSTSDEDAARMNVRGNQPLPVVPAARGKDSASNGVSSAPVTSRSLTSEEEEALNGPGPHHNRPGWVSNSNRPRDVGQYPLQPRPAERKSIPATDSLSSTEYSSPREPHSPNNYLPKPVNTRGRRGTDTDSLSAFDDSRRVNHRSSGNTPTRRVYRDNGYSAPYGAVSPDVQARSGALANGRYGGTTGPTPSNLIHHQPQQRRPSANQTMSYSDESENDEDRDSISHQQFVLDFPSEAEDPEGIEKQSTRKTTVRKTTTTPVTGVVRVAQQPSVSEVVRDATTRTVTTTPVFGVVSIPEPEEPRHSRVAAPPERNRTPVVGLISVSRSPSPERTKTPIVGLISVPPTQSHALAPTLRTHQPITGTVSVSNSNQFIQGRRSNAPSTRLTPDFNNNINAYPKFRTDHLSSSVIETFPSHESQSEIVGIDPELRRAQKTGFNQYSITMNLRPVVGDSSELGYEVYDTAIGRATPIAMDRHRMNGSTADWRYSEGLDGPYFRSPSVGPPMGTLRSQQSGVRTPNSQLGFVTRRSGSSVSKLNPVSYPFSSQGRIISPGGRRQDYDIPRSSVVGTMDGRRSLSRLGPQYPRDTLLQIQPIRQTVISSPRRLSSDAAELPGYNQHFLGGGGRGSRQKRLSSTMSSVFLSPTVDRRCNNLNAAAYGPSLFRDDTFYREGRFH